MGIENNECIIATTCSEGAIKTIQLWIKQLPEEQQTLFAILPGLVNGKQTIVMAPDGSKKGWETAYNGAKLRTELIAQIVTLPFDWVEVGYGEYGQKVLQGNNVNQYNDKVYAE